VSLLRTCPRCGAVARQPGLWASHWVCDEHGEILPASSPVAPTPELMRRLARDSNVPVWLPWPLPEGWQVSGLRWAGDDSSGTVASVVAVSGAHPIPVIDGPDGDGGADLVVVAEQPGVGFGAHLAGLDTVDPGPMLAERVVHDAAEIKIVADGHDIPLWSVPIDDGLAYVGEASGVWLWMFAWPATAAAVLLNRFALVDTRNPDHDLDFPCGTLSARLR